MAKFFGKVGYVAEVRETAPGVWQELPNEREYYGDVIRNSRRLDNGEKVNNDLSVGNSISIVADAYASEHFFAMRYVEWMGALWTISNIDVEGPRLILRLGGVYNGNKVGPSSAP